MMKIKIPRRHIQFDYASVIEAVEITTTHVKAVEGVHKINSASVQCKLETKRVPMHPTDQNDGTK